MVENHVSYLWQTKLKSRQSFLMLLEFIEPLEKKEYASLLHMLRGEGAQRFFDEYIAKSL